MDVILLWQHSFIRLGLEHHVLPLIRSLTEEFPQQGSDYQFFSPHFVVRRPDGIVGPGTYTDKGGARLEKGKTQCERPCRLSFPDCFRSLYSFYTPQVVLGPS
jgi:hypothetical protein